MPTQDLFFFSDGEDDWTVLPEGFDGGSPSSCKTSQVAANPLKMVGPILLSGIKDRNEFVCFGV